MVVCPGSCGGLSWFLWWSVLVSVVICPGVGGDLSWCRWWSVLGSVVAPVGVLPPETPAVPSPSLDVARRRPPRQPPDDVTGAAAADWFVWPLLECVGAVGAEGQWWSQGGGASRPCPQTPKRGTNMSFAPKHYVGPFKKRRPFLVPKCPKRPSCFKRTL